MTPGEVGMAAEWYYTTNKQQMGPVSWDELRQLAGAGLLKPSDLVWTDGMSEWVKAVRQNDLFAAEGPASKGVTAPRSEVDAPPPRRSATRRRIDDEMDEYADEDRREKRRARKGSGSGLKIGIIIGLVAVVLLVLGCGVVGIIFVAIGLGGGGIAGENNYALNLAPNAQNDRTFQFQGGQRVTVTVTTARAFGPLQPDVDLFILHRGNVIAFDTRVHPDCLVTFVAPANDTYIVRVKNLGPGRASSRVNVQ
jgi:hypothetical protein